MNLMGRYNAIVVLAISLQIIVLMYVTTISEPLSGDLTRIGGHSETRFGWNEPQVQFKRPQFFMARSVDSYDHYYDVVVLGDSFSSDTRKGWENYFGESTGLSVITFYLADGITLRDVISSPQYKKTPPRIFVYETVERLALLRLHELAGKPWPILNNPSRTSLLKDELKFHERPKKAFSRKQSLGLEQRFSEAASYIDKSKFRVFGKDNGKTLVYRLNTKGLFSSQDSSNVLVLTADNKKYFSDEDIQNAMLGAKKAEAYVEKNGKTRFFLMIFPDKLTAYSKFLDDPSVAAPSYIPAIAEYFPIPRLDNSFEQKLINGVDDLYLPNDTHTGYHGHKAAAESLINFIFH